LFEKSISRTEHFEIPLIEDTFDYALRFTHHRPRDLQKLIRIAVSESARKTNRTKDDVLRGTGGYKISGKHLRKAVHAYRRDATSLLIEEFERGNPGFSEKVTKLQGFPASLVVDDFTSKLEHVGLESRLDLRALWYSGIIGIEVFCDKGQQNFQAILPEEAKKTDKDINNNSITRGYFFEYNTDMDINEIIRRYRNGEEESTNVNIVFHPKTFDSIIGQQDRKWPIGI